MNNNDQEWFDALAGKASIEEESILKIEAIAVRRALIARRTAIESDAKEFNEKDFDSLKKSLIKAGFLKEKNHHKFQSIANLFFGRASSTSSSAVIQRIGIFAAIILIIGIIVKGVYIPSKPEDNMLLRGDGDITYIIDENPEKKYREYIADLNNIKAEYTSEKQSYGKISLKIKSSEEVEEYLYTKRINNIKVVDGYINIVITPPQSNKN
jgi:hypothetical protein